MNTSSNNATTPLKKTVRKRFITLVTLALIGVGSVAIFSLRQKMTLPNDPPKEIARFVATEQFVSLPDDQKQAYVTRLEQLSFEERRRASLEADLTPQQAEAAYRNVFRQAAHQRVNTYFSITDEQARKAYLDQVIDEFEKEQAFKKHQPPNPGQIKAYLESISPGQRARTAEFMSAFVQRRLVRGLGLFQ